MPMMENIKQKKTNKRLDELGPYGERTPSEPMPYSLNMRFANGYYYVRNIQKIIDKIQF